MKIILFKLFIFLLLMGRLILSKKTISEFYIEILLSFTLLLFNVYENKEKLNKFLKTKLISSFKIFLIIFTFITSFGNSLIIYLFIFREYSISLIDLLISLSCWIYCFLYWRKSSRNRKLRKIDLFQKLLSIYQKLDHRHLYRDLEKLNEILEKYGLYENIDMDSNLIFSQNIDHYDENNFENVLDNLGKKISMLFLKKSQFLFETYKMKNLCKKKIEAYIKNNSHFLKVERPIYEIEKKLILNHFRFSQKNTEEIIHCLICFLKFEKNSLIINFDKKQNFFYHDDCLFRWFSDKFICPFSKTPGAIILLNFISEISP